MTLEKHAATRLLLAKQRQMTSLLEKEIIAESSDVVFSKEDWVPLYMDLGNMVVSDCGQFTAYRAATLKGQLIWMVYTSGKEKGYHAMCDDPVDAIERAKETWNHRRAIRQNWCHVEKLQRDLLRGRQRFDVRVEDLKASPLCSLGIEGFRSAVGLGRITRIPGWLAALLMKIEPQMGFVLYEAKCRHQLARDFKSRETAEGFQTVIS